MLRPHNNPAGDGAHTRTWRAPTALVVLVGLVWAIAVSPAGFFHAADTLGHPSSFEVAQPATKALQPQASVVWREKTGQRGYGGRHRPQAETVLTLLACALLAASAGLQSGMAPQLVSQSFLIFRTHSPRDPPAV
jgi:hypothetical protein